MKTDEKKIVEDMLGDEFVQKMLPELGIQNSSREAQEEVLARIGQTVLEKVALEILSVLPESVRDEFATYVGKGDVAGMRIFLQPYIPDPDSFILKHAQNSYESVKTRIHQLAQGVL